MKISVVGTGYVGLVSGTCFAEMGNSVICVDNDENKVGRMLEGQVPIYEPGLEDLFDRNTREGRLDFTADLKAGIKDAEAVFLALPTSGKENGEADLGPITSVARQLGQLINSYTVIVNKSTVPVGTADMVHGLIAQSADTENFDVVSNPEFLREGQAVPDFLKPDRVVIGSRSARALTLMKRLYKPFVPDEKLIHEMDTASAELTKYAANGMLATRISYMNFIANLCEKYGADIDKVRLAIGADDRIGSQFLYAGPGYGGSCFPKDLRQLAHTANQAGVDPILLDAVETINEAQKVKIVKDILDDYKGDIEGKTFAVWGLAFKKDTDDVRESPAITIINELVKRGARVQASDPEAIKNAQAVIADEAVTYSEDHYKVLEGAEALIVATDWREFKAPDFRRIAGLLKNKRIYDARILFSAEVMHELGFYYRSIGRTATNG